jgi:hypothetical protein
MVGEIGDGTLTSFHSAIDAVNCAREVQASLQQDQPDLKVRIGIHLGDVVFSGNTVLGDGDNVASRKAWIEENQLSQRIRSLTHLRHRPKLRAGRWWIRPAFPSSNLRDTRLDGAPSPSTMEIELWRCGYPAPCRAHGCKANAETLVRYLDEYGRLVRQTELCDKHVKRTLAASGLKVLARELGRDQPRSPPEK